MGDQARDDRQRIREENEMRGRRYEVEEKISPWMAFDRQEGASELWKGEEGFVQMRWTKEGTSWSKAWILEYYSCGI